MAVLHLMVGLPCSGKTTEARRLEKEYHALRLTPDEWQIRLFGQDALDPSHDERHGAIEKIMWEVASRALSLGMDVILDFGFSGPGGTGGFPPPCPCFGRWVSNPLYGSLGGGASSPAARCSKCREARRSLCDTGGGDAGVYGSFPAAQSR